MSLYTNLMESIFVKTKYLFRNINFYTKSAISDFARQITPKYSDHVSPITNIKFVCVCVCVDVCRIIWQFVYHISHFDFCGSSSNILPS